MSAPVRRLPARARSAAGSLVPVAVAMSNMASTLARRAAAAPAPGGQPCGAGRRAARHQREARKRDTAAPHCGVCFNSDETETTGATRHSARAKVLVYDREVSRVRVASAVGASRWRSLLTAVLPDRGLASCDTR